MAMLITKFNKMIRSRILWGALAFLIAFAFVGSSLLNRSGCQGDVTTASAAGVLYGESVPHRDYLAARYFELGMRDPSDITEEGEVLLHRRTWSRLAALRLAEQMGITATDAELAEMIRRDPTFAVGGVFNRDQYRAVVQQRLGVAIPTFEAYSRQDLVMRKIQDALSSASWISPSELNYRLRNFTDRFTVESALITESDLKIKRRISDEDVAAYYEAHRDEFMESERVRVRYVSFPISKALVEGAVSEEDLEDYYDAHIDDFTSTDTNGTESTLPLTDETVRDRVLASVSEEKAVFAARDTATELVMTLAPDRAGQAPLFEAAAQGAGLTVSTSEYFSTSEPVPGLNVGPDFNTWAFRLDPDDPESYFSDAIAGEDSVFIIAALDRRPAAVPELDAIVDRVRLAAEEQARRDAIAEKGNELRESLVDRLAAKDESFQKAAEHLSMAVSTTITFSVYGLIEDSDTEGADALIDTVPTMEVGEISQPVSTTNGWMFIHLVDRQAGDPVHLSMLKGELQSAYDQYRIRLTFRDWQEYALERGELEDRSRAAQDDDSSTTDDEEADEPLEDTTLPDEEW